MVISPEAMDLQEAGIGAFFRPRDLVPLGISHRRLQRLVNGGVVENFGHGLYRLTEVPATELETVAMVAAAVPNSVVCLLTALQFHDIGTQMPHEIWIALDRKARKPTHPPARLRIVRFSGPMLTYGVVRRRALGVPFRITSPARTVVDCFRYRNKFGIDFALEALHNVLRSRTASVDEIMRAAEACRARTVMRAYLEALPP
jgi:predicted transcriptional regulator of viral defense system